MKYKGHYNQFFNCLTCNKRTDIMLDNCTNCGSRTPVDQKDYRRMRTRKLNEILISKFEKVFKRDDRSLNSKSIEFILISEVIKILELFNIQLFTI